MYEWKGTATMKDKKTVYKKLGNYIRIKRLDKKMTMKELGKRIGVSEGTISRYETGERKITFDSFVDICKVLDLNPLDVVKEVDNEN